MDEVTLMVVFEFMKKLFIEIAVEVISGVISKLFMGSGWGQICVWNFRMRFAPTFVEKP